MLIKAGADINYQDSKVTFLSSSYLRDGDRCLSGVTPTALCGLNCATACSVCLRWLKLSNLVRKFEFTCAVVHYWSVG
jgi:hypothetical protein